MFYYLLDNLIVYFLTYEEDLQPEASVTDKGPSASTVNNDENLQPQAPVIDKGPSTSTIINDEHLPPLTPVIDKGPSSSKRQSKKRACEDDDLPMTQGGNNFFILYIVTLDLSDLSVSVRLDSLNFV